MANKKGRPFSVQNKREKFSLSLTLAEGAMDKLFERYGTEQNATAIREGIHELLGINENIIEKKDSNSSRQKRKELAKELGTTVSEINRMMEKKKCSLEKVKKYF
ncbi:MAG: hypothetical protein HRU18_01480 [Pseudoalteromonas sp.]|uniref:hypothetical protein n=1 Tax=Pseudoalteromonas sp. TaxID=53249 RepID=UPI001DF13C77|nr:hypothetical protein [Pseudoalteromonas sp.]NRA76852.1 hypothetical protein [Pseudoalteromonas sp.]